MGNQRFRPLIALSGIPITSSQPTTGQTLVFDPVTNQFIFATVTATQGPKGAKGPKGVNSTTPGANGLQGTAGVQGQPGPDGQPGINGQDGVQGIPGPDGTMGLQGPPGNNIGPTGPTGPTGVGPWHRITDATTAQPQVVYSQVRVPPVQSTWNTVAGPATTEGTGKQFFFIEATTAPNCSGAFRAGEVTTAGPWIKANRGQNSVAGGLDNRASGARSSAIGGTLNVASGADTIVLGGASNTASGDRSCVGGGQSNTAGGVTCFVGGGNTNVALAGGVANSIMAGTGNNIGATSTDCVIGGGSTNNVGMVTLGVSAGIGCGLSNVVNATNACIFSGAFGTCRGNNSVICGGSSNTIDLGSIESAILGGNTCSIDQLAVRSAILAGSANVIRVSTDSCIAAGGNNQIVSSNSSLACGDSCTIQGANECFVGGTNGHALTTHNNSFVWSDNSGSPLNSVGARTMTVCSIGGVYIYTNNARTTGPQVLPGANAWSVPSDREMKNVLKELEDAKMLEKLVANVPISTFSYVDDESEQISMGPMAQDWHATFFSPGKDKLKIDTTDIDGITLSAIRALVRQIESVERDYAALNRDIDNLSLEICGVA